MTWITENPPAGCFPKYMMMMMMMMMIIIRKWRARRNSKSPPQLWPFANIPTSTKRSQLSKVV